MKPESAKILLVAGIVDVVVGVVLLSFGGALMLAGVILGVTGLALAGWAFLKLAR